jgi:hypothetical protein
MPDDRRAIARAHYEQVLEDRRPVARVYVDKRIDERLWNCEVLVLPLGSDGKTIDMLMSAFVWPDESF